MATTPFDMWMWWRSSLFILTLFPGYIHAQHCITGRVVNSGGTPLTGAAIFLHETHQGTLADSTGSFELCGVKSGSYHLHITYSGYHSEEQDISLNENLILGEIRLTESINELHEAVIEMSLSKEGIHENSANVTVLDRHALEQQSQTTLMGKLAQIPGVSAITNGTGISKPVIRGLSGNRVVVSQSGIRQEGQQWGSDHGLEIDPYQIDQVEIIKGPAALVFGSDAVGGVVNVRPAIPHAENTYEGGLQMGWNTLNQNLVSSAHAKLNRKGNYLVGRVTRQRSSDYQTPGSSFVYQNRVLPIYEGRIKNTAVSELDWMMLAGLSRSWGYLYVQYSDVHQQSGFFSGAFDVPSASRLRHDGSFRNIELPFQTVRHQMAMLHSNIQVGRNWLEADLGFQSNHRQEVARPHAGLPYAVDSISLGLNLTTMTGNLRYFFKNPNVSRTAGFSTQIQSNTHSGYEFLIPDFNTGEAGFYWVENRNQSENWKFNYGARIQFNSISFESTTTPFWVDGAYAGDIVRNAAYHKQHVNWAASLGLTRLLTKKLTVKVNSARTFRMMRPNELATNGIHHGAFRFEKGNLNLHPEIALQNDLSVEWERSRWLVTLSVYGNYFFNFIYLKPAAVFAKVEVNGEVYPYPEAGQLYEYVQGPTKHYGWESQLEYRVTSALSFIHSSEYAYVQNVESGEFIPFVPPMGFRHALDYRLKASKKKRFPEDAHLRVESQLALSQERTARNEAATPGYHLMHAGISMEWHGGLRLSIQGANLLNARYLNNMSRYRILNLPELGRTVLLQMTYVFDGKMKSVHP